jgi:hypothetical protein
LKSAAGRRRKFWNNDKLLEFESQRDDPFPERRQVVLVAVAGLANASALALMTSVSGLAN